MVKRKRNSIGQFITNKNLFEGIKSNNISSFIMNKISAIFFMVIFFLLLVSPWLTLIIKSKQLKIFLYSLLNFYSEGSKLTALIILCFLCSIIAREFFCMISIKINHRRIFGKEFKDGIWSSSSYL